MNNKLRVAARNYINWLESAALPLWSSKGIDKGGASIEQFTSLGEPDYESNRRIRVQARQMFVFSAAQQQDWIGNGIELVASIDTFCNKYAKKAGKTPYVHMLNASNEIINDSNDLYDIAFFLLAYGWRYHVFKDLNALNKANELLNIIDSHLKDSPGGWMEGDYFAENRRQNPHMHLFEAFLALYQFTNDGKWLAKAGEVYCLFETVFFDHENGVLLEYFDQNWQVCNDETGSIVEPGHMMEWVWLLRQYQKHTQAPVDEYCSTLYHQALKLGLDKVHNVLFDQVSVSGKIIKGSKRCWPMTEWIKASLIQARFSTEIYDYENDALTALTQLTSRYLNSKQLGQYVDSLDEAGKVLVNNSPASTLYHLVIAGIEVKQHIEYQFT